MAAVIRRGAQRGLYWAALTVGAWLAIATGHAIASWLSDGTVTLIVR